MLFLVSLSVDDPEWYSQSLKFFHVIKSPTLDHSNLILHQLPAE